MQGLLAFKSSKFDAGIKAKVGRRLAELKRAGYRVNRRTYANVMKEILAREHWDGYVHFYRMHKDGLAYVPTGLIPYLLREAERHNVKFATTDNRRKVLLSRLSMPILQGREAAHPAITIKGQKLRDYQVAAVDSIYNNFLESGLDDKIWFPRGVIEVATAGGKTGIIAETISRFLAVSKRGPHRVIVLVHTKDLLWQTREELNQILARPVGVIGDGEISEECEIVVSTVQTLSDIKAFKLVLESCELLISDECHHLSAETFRKTATACVNAIIRVGVSATPFKNDIVEIQYIRGVTGDPLFIKKAKELEAEGYIVPVNLYLLPIKTEGAERLKYYDQDKGKIPGAYSICIQRHADRNAAIKSFVESRPAGSHCLVLTPTTTHGRILADLLGCPFLSGKESSTVRKSALRTFGATNGDSAKSIHVLVATTILDEGVDSPGIDYLVLAGAGKAPWRFVQRIGRGRRKKAGKLHLSVLDFLDLGHRTVREQSRQRVLTAEAEGYTIINIKDVKEIP